MNPVLRKLRIAFSATCLIACVLLIALWVRSYWRLDLVKWNPRPKQVVAFRSDRGMAEFHYLDLTPCEDDASMQAWEDSFLRPQPFVDPIPLWPAFYSGTEEWRDLVRYSFFIPYWLLVAFTAALGVAPWLRWRFSLRTLLIATTLIAVVLGLVMWSLR